MSSQERSTANNVFLGDISAFCNESDLKSLFNDHGFEADIKIMRESTSDTCLGYGFATLPSHEEAERAINTLHKTIIRGRPLKVRWAGYKIKNLEFDNSQYFTLYVKFNTKKSGIRMTDEIFRKHFETFHPVDVIVKYKRITPGGTEHGYGFVHFDCTEQGIANAQYAMHFINHNANRGSIRYTCELCNKTQTKAINAQFSNPLEFLIPIESSDSQESSPPLSPQLVSTSHPPLSTILIPQQQQQQHQQHRHQGQQHQQQPQKVLISPRSALKQHPIHLTQLPPPALGPPQGGGQQHHPHHLLVPPLPSASVAPYVSYTMQSPRSPVEVPSPHQQIVYLSQGGGVGQPFITTAPAPSPQAVLPMQPPMYFFVHQPPSHEQITTTPRSAREICSGGLPLPQSSAHLIPATMAAGGANTYFATTANTPTILVTPHPSHWVGGGDSRLYTHPGFVTYA